MSQFEKDSDPSSAISAPSSGNAGEAAGKKEKGILFSGGMVRAILAGRKTQTRRVIKDATGAFWDHAGWKPVIEGAKLARWVTLDGTHENKAASPTPDCPFGGPGGHIWVRETWAPLVREDAGIIYQADRVFRPLPERSDPSLRAWIIAKANEADHWRPSIHLPRWACRLVLEVVAVRAARLREIDELEARAEGIFQNRHGVYHWDDDARVGNESARNAFARLWDSINRDRGFGWDTNPWVWCIEFRPIQSLTSSPQHEEVGEAPKLPTEGSSG